jgi:ankyrin repeat domain-containing protein 50
MEGLPTSFQPAHKVPILSATDLKLLNTLKVVPYLDRKDRNPHRVPGTCEWFVSHNLFRDWLENSSGRSKALWVSADPGCGKSVLAKYMVDHVLQTTADRTTCYFFFKDDFEDQKNIANAISCILHQLFTQKPLLFSDAIRARLEAEGNDLTLPFRDLWDLLLSAAGNENAGEILCVLDALDECQSGDCQELATALLNRHRTGKAPNLRFFLTSRPFGSIRRSFQLPDIADLAVVHLSGENEAEVEQISKEIDIFIKARVAAIGARLMLEKDEQDMLLDGLLRVPHRTYLWVYLTLGLVESDEDINRGKLRRAVSQLPGSVSDAYEKVLSTSRHPEEARKALHIIVAAETPLTLREMNFALALRPEHHSYDDVDLALDERFRERLRDICGLFVTVIDSRVYLFHQTAKEFLVRPISWKQEPPDLVDPRGNLPKNKWKHSFHPADSHQILGQICLWLLQFPELLSHEGGWVDLDQLPPRFVLLDYSSSYWDIHLRAPHVRIDKKMTDAIVAVCQACHDRLPFWFISMMEVRPEGDNFLVSYRIDNQHNMPTLLMLASFLGLTPAVKALIKTGSNSDLHATDRKGRTALAWAVVRGHLDTAKALIGGKPGVLRGLGWLGIWKPAGLETRNIYGITPLMLAVKASHEGIVRLLLDNGADIETRDLMGSTPLVCNPMTNHAPFRGCSPGQTDPRTVTATPTWTKQS